MADAARSQAREDNAWRSSGTGRQGRGATGDQITKQNRVNRAAGTVAGTSERTPRRGQGVGHGTSQTRSRTVRPDQPVKRTSRQTQQVNRSKGQRPQSRRAKEMQRTRQKQMGSLRQVKRSRKKAPSKLRILLRKEFKEKIFDYSILGKKHNIPANGVLAGAQPVRKVKVEVPLQPQTQKNREKALGTNMGMVIFLSIALVAVTFCCVRYIRMRALYMNSVDKVAELESTLTSLMEDNDAYYSSVISNVDLIELKKQAVSQLGLNTPSEAQMQTYTLEDNGGYLWQYQDIKDE